jgi:hypothetical protein
MIPTAYRRHAIGVIAVILLSAAWALWRWPVEADWYTPVMAACWRLGPCMAVLWLAYPEVNRLPAWLIGVIPLLLAILAVRPRWFLIALPIVIALVILKPKAGRS